MAKRGSAVTPLLIPNPGRLTPKKDPWYLQHGALMAVKQ